jgi:phosphatidylinositol glycan class B
MLFLCLLSSLISQSTFVLVTSSISDRLYFGMWTFPPYQLLHFNITQALAVFYGVNNWHYYISQGLPLLLTTYLPFVAPALWSSTSLWTAELSPRVSNIRFQLSCTIITMISTLSIVSHKEVRFIYPLLPSLHILLAPHVLAFFNAASYKSIIANSSVNASITIASWRRNLLVLLVLSNLSIGFYTALVHQRGVIDVLKFLRTEYEEIHLSQRGLLTPLEGTDDKFNDRYGGGDVDETFAAFLMPCHSTPWRSHLVYPNLKAWALTCEPPVHIPANTPERAAYVDEGDVFYANPVGFLKNRVNTKQRPWPRYIVGFQGIETDLKEYYKEAMPGWKVQEKWRGFNSHWHDDSRRTGDVVVWEFVDGSKVT